MFDKNKEILIRDFKSPQVDFQESRWPKASRWLKDRREEISLKTDFIIWKMELCDLKRVCNIQNYLKFTPFL